MDLSFTHMVPLNPVVSLLLILEISNFLVNKQVGDKNGHVLILDVNIDEIRYVLDNIYNANNEAEQVQVLSELMKNKFFGRKSYSFSWRSQCIF